MKKVIFTILGTVVIFAATAQDSGDKNRPAVYISKAKAENAKSMIEDEGMVTFYHCATSEIAYSIEKPKVKIKSSTLGEPYFDVFVIGKDQTGKKRERKIMLDQIWFSDEEENYTNLADELDITWEECTAHDMPSYLKK